MIAALRDADLTELRNADFTDCQYFLALYLIIRYVISKLFISQNLLTYVRKSHLLYASFGIIIAKVIVIFLIAIN